MLYRESNWSFKDNTANFSANLVCNKIEHVCDRDNATLCEDWNFI